MNAFLVSAHAISGVLRVQRGKQNSWGLKEQKTSAVPTKP